MADSVGSENSDNMKATTSKEKSKYSHPVYKQMAALNGQINSQTRVELVKTLGSLHLDTEGSKTVLIKRLKNFYRRMLLNVADVQERHENARVRVMFDYYVVIDFEATCEYVSQPKFKQEIIEFPAILLNCRTCEIEDEFRSFCQPTINPLLSEFCTDLTGIGQEDVDKAPYFPEVLQSFDNWIQSKKLGTKYSFAIVCDGPWDMGKFLKNQCEYSGVDFPPFCNYWVNIRKTFANFYNTGRIPLNCMLQLIGREFEGRAHCGLDDARNITFILQRLLLDGAKVIFNEKLADDPPDKRRIGRDGNPYFSSPVYEAEFKSVYGKLPSNFPCKKVTKI